MTDTRTTRTSPPNWDGYAIGVLFANHIWPTKLAPGLERVVGLLLTGLLVWVLVTVARKLSK